MPIIQIDFHALFPYLICGTPGLLILGQHKLEKLLGEFTGIVLESTKWKLEVKTKPKLEVKITKP
ncbi:MAG: hypothetical protein WBV73_22130 [Phormidium sp.]